MKLIERIFKRNDYYITSPFGDRTRNGKKEFHNGCDYGTNREKWELYAVEQGEVKLVNKSTIAGNIIEIFYPRLNLTTRFIHCDKIISKKGDKVDNNTIVAYVGATGSGVTGIHLHLGLKNKDGKFIDPELYDYQEETKKSVEELAKEVINGKWGNGEERKQRLSDGGYDYKEVQDKVNEILKQDKPVKPKTYLVKRGDTLTGIARDNNINMMDLYIKNKKLIDSENKRRGVNINRLWVYPGQLLKLD